MQKVNKKFIHKLKPNKSYLKIQDVTKKKRDCGCHANQWLPIGKPVMSTNMSPNVFV